VHITLDMALFLQRISAYDRLTNAVREIVPDVMNTAASKDAMLAAYNANGTALPLLFCVPILLKDNFDALDGKGVSKHPQSPLLKVWAPMCYIRCCAALHCLSIHLLLPCRLHISMCNGASSLLLYHDSIAVASLLRSQCCISPCCWQSPLSNANAAASSH